jgi:serine/threonine-protein kinase HipA
VAPLAPDAARGVQVADVYKAGRLAAQLRRHPEGTEFRYLSDYLEGAGMPVATTLPLTDEPRITPAGAVPPFFAGLLPEGRRLTGLRRRVKTSADDELSLVLAVGRDPIGDVQVVPEGDVPEVAEALVVVERSFDEVRFSDLLSDAGVIDPISIAGVQDKASAQVISVPVGRAGNRYILKIDPPEYPHLVVNEDYFLALARAVGMPVVDAELVHDAEGREGLLVRRFDREPEPDGSSSALACEDACQLLDRWPADKYNVTSEQVVGAVAHVCAAAPVAVRDVFRQLCFAWLTGNGDVHAKNVSVLADGTGEWRVAPAYDLPCTVLYNDNSLALSIGGRRSGFSRKALLEFANAMGLNSRAALSVLDDVYGATADVVADLVNGALPFDQDTLARTSRQIQSRRKQLDA